MLKVNNNYKIASLLSLVGAFIYILTPAQTLAASTSTASLTDTSPITSTIVTGTDTSNNSDVTVDGSSDTVAPTTPTWVTSNPDVGPLSQEYGLYNLKAIPPCSTATATSINLAMAGISLQFNGTDVDTEANAGAAMWLVNPADGSTGTPIINSGVQDGSWVGGSTIVSNGVARGYNNDPMASGIPLVGEFNADYAITSSPGEVIDFQVLVRQGMRGGFVTATDIETSTPVATVTWDDSSCPATSGGSNNSGSAQTNSTSATSPDNQSVPTKTLAKTGFSTELILSLAAFSISLAVASLIAKRMAA